jgi:hypothetical protein
MLLPLLVVFFVVARLDIPGEETEIMGVRSVFPLGDPVAVPDAENGWQGVSLPGRFRFFRRASSSPREDFQALKRKNFPGAPPRADLDLFAGGLVVLQRQAKGYRMTCLFHEGDAIFWADMVSTSSLDLSCRAFERFMLNLEIGGRRVSAQASGQVAGWRRRVSPFVMQTPGQLLAMMAALFALVLLIIWRVNRFSGSCPRRADPCGDECTPHATLRISGFARRQLSACCLCREGEALVIYRFRRPFMKIDLRSERQHIAWEKTSFRYKNIRVTMAYEDFAKWRLRLMA